jgi:hypothetical protein
MLFSQLTHKTHSLLFLHTLSLRLHSYSNFLQNPNKEKENPSSSLPFKFHCFPLSVSTSFHCKFVFFAFNFNSLESSSFHHGAVIFRNRFSSILALYFCLALKIAPKRYPCRSMMINFNNLMFLHPYGNFDGILTSLT